MAGTIIADYIRSDANRISLNVGNTVIASVNAMGILSNTGAVMINSSGTINANNISTGRIVTPSVMPANSVLQIVTANLTTQLTTASTSAVDTGLFASITPTATTSKILVMYCAGAGTSSASGGQFNWVLRDSTIIHAHGVSYSGGGSSYGTASAVILDSPSTTSSVTYKVQCATQSASSTAYFNADYGTFTGETARIILMEIAG